MISRHGLLLNKCFVSKCERRKLPPTLVVAKWRSDGRTRKARIEQVIVFRSLKPSNFGKVVKLHSPTIQGRVIA